MGQISSSNDSAIKNTTTGEPEPEKVEKMASEGTLFAIPDLTSILYTESYDKFIATKEPVVPAVQYWGPQQSVYIGCKGGQILVVDSESGLVTVLANPQMIEV